MESIHLYLKKYIFISQAICRDSISSESCEKSFSMFRRTRFESDVRRDVGSR